jgi:hypothetical protein
MTLPPRVSDLAAFELLLSVARAGSIGRAAAEHVSVTGVDLTRTLRAVWTAGRRLTGPALDLYTIAARACRRART